MVRTAFVQARPPVGVSPRKRSQLWSRSDAAYGAARAGVEWWGFGAARQPAGIRIPVTQPYRGVEVRPDASRFRLSRPVRRPARSPDAGPSGLDRSVDVSSRLGDGDEGARLAV